MDETTSSKTNWTAFILIFVFIVIVVGILALVFLNGKKKEAPAGEQAKQAATSYQVAITKDGLSPQTIKIKKGDSVVWTNKDTAVHDLRSDPYPKDDTLPDLKSDPLEAHASYSFTFEKAGTFSYHDENNPLVTKWKGQVEVE